MNILYSFYMSKIHIILVHVHYLHIYNNNVDFIISLDSQ